MPGTGPPLKLTVDRQNKTLVAFNGTPSRIPDLFQSNLVTLQIQIVDPGITNGPVVTSSSSYTVINMYGFGLRASVGMTPTGTPGGPAPLALQDTFTWDPPSQSFYADLALNTTGIDTFLGALSSLPAYFELNVTSGAGRNTILQTTFNLKAVVDELLSLVPTPGNQYYTVAETNGRFMPRVGEPGAVLTLRSPDGTKTYELGVDNNGQLSSNQT